MPPLNLADILKGDAQQAQQLFTALAQINGVEPSAYRAKLAAQLFAPIYLPESLHPELRLLMAPLQAQFEAALSCGDGFYLDQQQWLRQLASWLHREACHWYPAEDKASQGFVQDLQRICELALAGNGEAVIAALNEVEQAAAKQEKRTALLVQRLCETERTQLRMIAAEAQVLRTLNQHLANRPFPQSLQPHLNTTLKAELQHLVLNHPDPGEYERQPMWQLWQRLLPVLGQTFSGAEVVVEDQHLYTHIPLLLDKLESSLKIATVNPLAYEQWVELLSEQLLAAIKKQVGECELLPELSGGGAANALTSVTPALMAQLDQFAVGDWFIYHSEDNQALRCQLALKEPELDQLLFVGRNGRKVLSKSVKDFAVCISTGIAVPLARADLSELLNLFLEPCVKQANSIVVKVEQANAAAQREQAAAAQAQQKQRQKLRQDAAKKAIAEAHALSAAKAQQDKLRREADAKAAVQDVEINQQRALNQVNELQVGAWMMVVGADGAADVRCKLSVILSSADKYIFVDDLGRKHGEYGRAALVQLLAAERAKITHKGNNFEDQLAKVIRGIRRDTA